MQITTAFPFQSTPSVWRETLQNEEISYIIVISIHSLRVEGDVIRCCLLWKKSIFQSTPSVWRETITCIYLMHLSGFQSTPSVWRETSQRYSMTHRGKVFQSTPSVWRETQDSLLHLLSENISIHSLRVEGDGGVQCSFFHLSDFNPLPPCGGRPLIVHYLRPKTLFQSTPSVWRETGKIM